MDPVRNVLLIKVLCTLPCILRGFRELYGLKRSAVSGVWHWVLEVRRSGRSVLVSLVGLMITAAGAG